MATPSSSNADRHKIGRRRPQFDEDVPSRVQADNAISILSDVSESMVPSLVQQEPPSSAVREEDELAQSFVPISSTGAAAADGTTSTTAQQHKTSEQDEENVASSSKKDQIITSDMSHKTPADQPVLQVPADSESSDGPRFKDQSHSFLDHGRASSNPSSSYHSATNATATRTFNSSNKSTTEQRKPPATTTAAVTTAVTPTNIVQDQEITPGLVEAQAVLVPTEDIDAEENQRHAGTTKWALWLLFAMMCGAGIAVLITCLNGKCSSPVVPASSTLTTSSPTTSPVAAASSPTTSPIAATSSPTTSPVDPVRAATITSVISGASVTSLSYPITNDTAEALSLQWLIEKDPLQLSVTAGVQRLTQRYAMGVLWFVLFGEQPPDADECSWDGVRACVNGNIGQLQMERVEMNKIIGGTLPPDLSLITQVTNVSMPAMNLRGTLPETYSRWTTIEEFYLEQNQLTGALPTSYQDWTFLRTFSVHGNVLNGTIPSEYSAWTSLERLLLFDNQLTGKIPMAWPFLQELWGHDNSLTGSLPSSIWSIGELRNLVLYNNRLSGSIPESLAANDLVLFELQSNSLTGTISEEFSLLTNTSVSLLDTFYVFDNDLTGSMPLCKTEEEITADIVADCAIDCSCCQGCVP